jgi:hypothetical protein
VAFSASCIYICSLDVSSDDLTRGFPHLMQVCVLLVDIKAAQPLEGEEGPSVHCSSLAGVTGSMWSALAALLALAYTLHCTLPDMFHAPWMLVRTKVP